MEDRMMRSYVLAVMLALSASTAMAQMGGGKMEEKMEVMKACKPDIARFCSQVPPGEGRIKACMKQHMRDLSEPCKEALFQAWLKD